ncbi:hypothetical protein cyc_08587 [Cyclospora cayetanensis]|uniref:Uncharacterized protein n=1 Tax=Cyclospora cayetanensis TaxID=88456 RepID=A0A1D3CYK6_9EIME|nr:hypothetical protein cyc_08587 [Cyclospora cayetanensis]
MLQLKLLEPPIQRGKPSRQDEQLPLPAAPAANLLCRCRSLFSPRVEHAAASCSISGGGTPSLVGFAKSGQEVTKVALEHFLTSSEAAEAALQLLGSCLRRVCRKAVCRYTAARAAVWEERLRAAESIPPSPSNAREQQQ